jgi:tungstate transport system ATP-binding protein
MNLIELKNIEHFYQKHRVLKLEKLEIKPGELWALLGPNGAGKSVLLRILATLEFPKAGEYFFKASLMNKAKNILALRRRITLTFQEALLYNRSVRQNIALGLKFRGIPNKIIQSQVKKWAALLKIEHLLERPALQLSGGEAQRTALARALVLEPELLLLDEPFGDLDEPSRYQLLYELKQILKAARITSVMVTHNREEALEFADYLGIMLEGELKQTGKPSVVFNNPVSEKVAKFVGMESILEGVVIAYKEGLAEVKVGNLILEAASELPPAREVLVCIRPEDIVIAKAAAAAQSSRNHLKLKISRILPWGYNYHIYLGENLSLKAIITRRSLQEMNLQVGDEVEASFKATAVHLIAR